MKRQGLWLVLALGLLLPFAYALAFCFPRADDFDEATRAMFLFDLPGGIYEIGREWLTWSGRYVYHFLAVFLGRAAQSGAVYGLVCGAVMLVYGLGVYLLFSPLADGKKPALPALAGILLVLSCCQALPCFYLLTDALTIALQGGAALVFFALLARLWQKSALDAECARLRGGAVLAGVLAIGVYEHAALAVMTAFAGCLFLAWLRDRRNAGKKMLPAFFPMLCWLAGAFLFSFLAPGNFSRKAARHVQDFSTVGELAGELASGLAHGWLSFSQSLWPWAALLIAILAAAWRADACRPAAGAVCARSAVVLAMCVAFSCGLVFVHAQSDVPFSSAPKLAASMHFYLCVGFSFIFYWLLRLLPMKGKAAAMCWHAVLFGILALVALSPNFRRTAENAANGQMLVLARALEERNRYLSALGRGAGHDSGPRFGLLGEVCRPGARKRSVDPTLPLAAAPAFDTPVFPVWCGEGLAPREEQWPNLWAAWYYGIGGVKAVKPVFSGPLPGVRLSVPAELGQIERAWRLAGKADPENPLPLDWILLKTPAPLPQRISILRPNPLSFGRLAPLPLQKFWLDDLLGKKETGSAGVAALACGNHVFETAAAGRNGYYAFPLGPGGMDYPPALFLSLDGRRFYRLSPAGKAFGENDESGRPDWQAIDY